MITAIDSSVLLCLFNAESDANRWLGLLMKARREGKLVICEVVYAELAPAFAAESELQCALEKLGVQFEPTSPLAAWQAGMVFRAYRNSGGPRQHIIPDFIVAAHAMVHADRLAASDRGYLRRYFPKLKLWV